VRVWAYCRLRYQFQTNPTPLGANSQQNRLLDAFRPDDPHERLLAAALDASLDGGTAVALDGTLDDRHRNHQIRLSMPSLASAGAFLLTGMAGWGRGSG
jgi:hypothetical protein